MGKGKKNKSDRVHTSDAFWRSASLLVSESSFKWLMLFCSNSQKFNSCVMDGQMDGPTNRRTDTFFNRDARTRFKRYFFLVSKFWIWVMAALFIDELVTQKCHTKKRSALVFTIFYVLEFICMNCGSFNH